METHVSKIETHVPKIVSLSETSVANLSRESTAVGSREREYVDCLGLPYSNQTGSIKFVHETLKRLDTEVTETVVELRAKYASKKNLVKSMDVELFRDITQPLLEGFAPEIWVESNFSTSSDCMNRKNLVYTRAEDSKLIAENLFCWVCRRFAASHRSTVSTNGHREPPTIPRRYNGMTIRDLRSQILREPGTCWAVATAGQAAETRTNGLENTQTSEEGIETGSLVIGDPKSPLGSLATNDPESSIIEPTSGLQRKRKRDWSDKYDAVEHSKVLQIFGVKNGNEDLLQFRFDAGHEKIDRDQTRSGLRQSLPTHTEGDVSRSTYTMHEIPSTPESRGSSELSRNDPDGDGLGTRDRTEQGHSFPLSSPDPEKMEHGHSTRTPPGESDAVEISAAQTEQQYSDRANARKSIPKTRSRGTQIHLRNEIFEWLFPDDDENKGIISRKALQLMKSALDEESERLRQAWGTGFDNHCTRLKGWADFALAIEEFRDSTEYRGSRRDWLSQGDLLANNGHGLKQLKALTKVQVAWRNVYPDLEISDFESGLGHILRDVIDSDVQNIEGLGKCLEELVSGINVDIQDWFQT